MATGCPKSFGSNRVAFHGSRRPRKFWSRKLGAGPAGNRSILRRRDRIKRHPEIIMGGD
jgi:hypothetical protein